MPLVDTTIGALEVPAPVGAQDAPIVDPTVSGLLAYLGFWIKYALDPALAAMTAPPVTDACPVANRFPVNPSSLVAKFSKPALFVWWDGKSVIKPFTTIKDVRQRDIHAMYVFDRVGSDMAGGNEARVRYAGLISTVDATWTRAISRRGHPGYAPPGFRADTPIGIILALNAIDYMGGQEGFLQELAAPSARQAAVQTGPQRLSRGNTVGIVQGYPSLHGVFRVLEECGQDAMTDADTMGDTLFSPSTGQDPLGQLNMDQRYLPGPDAV